MKFLNKLGQKAQAFSKFGHKVTTKAGMGIRKVSKAVQRYAPKVEEFAGKVAEAATIASAGPGPIGAVGKAALVGASALSKGAKLASNVAKQTADVGRGLEKIGKKDYEGGFKQASEAKDKAMSHFK
jgi:hypothetical protein